MDFWFLSFDRKTQTGSAVPLVFKGRSGNSQTGNTVRLPLKESGGISCGPPQRKCEVELFPEQIEDDLYRSAKAGVERAYDLLWQEGYVRESLTAYFLRDNLSNVKGSSGSLLFGVATLVMAMRCPQGYPPVAATGSLDVDGAVLSVEGVPQKLLAALAAMPPGSLLFYPRQNEWEIDANLIAAAKAKDAQLLPISRLDEAAQHLGIDIRKTYTGAPYLGLFPFQYEHRRIYFGRQNEVAKLCDRLLDREATGSSGLLIIAASGAGKSSLVRAGLIPALETGPHALEKRPIVWATWRPSFCLSKSEAALAQSILAAWQKQPNAKAIFAKLAAPTTLSELEEQLATSFPAQRRFLWLIDQFEEVFTADFGSETLKSLVTFLEHLQASGVWIIATLRNDFYPQYQQSPFVRLFGDDGLFNLLALNTNALDQIIKGPAELAGYGWETAAGVSLADRLLRDIGDSTDALPLLEFVLYRLHHIAAESGPREMRFASYEEVGGLLGAIGRHAENTFQKIPDDLARASLNRLLWKLTAAEQAGERQIAARPFSLNDFPEGDPGRSLIKTFTDQRLLVQYRHDNGEIHVRVAHDALLEQWPKAKQAIDDFISDKQLHERLKAQAHDWKNASPEHAAGFLLPGGPLLANAEALLERQHGIRELLNTQMIEWIEASGQAERNRQTAQWRQMKKRTLQAWSLAALMGVVAIGAGGAGVWAWQAKRQADFHRGEAEALINYMLYDLREKLDAQGRVDLMEGLAQRAQRYFSNATMLSGLDSAALGELAVASNNHGDAFYITGRLDSAMGEYRQSLNIHQRLAAKEPGNSGWQRDISLSHTKVGDVLVAQGQLDAALREFRKSLDIYQRLTDQNPENAGWQRDLSISHERIGDVLMAQTHLDAALSEFRKCLEIRQQLVAQDSENVGWQRDLSVSHNKIGDILVVQGQLKTALGEFRKGLDIRLRLAAQDPGNAGWQRDLSVSHCNVGDALKQQGLLDAAMGEYRKGLDIRQRLASRDNSGSNTQAQADLAFAHLKLAMLMHQQKQIAQALAKFRQAATLLQTIVKLKPQHVQWQKALETTNSTITELALNNAGKLPN